jgi:hypothetical protein
MQCFENASHSRFFVPGKADNLVLLSPQNENLDNTQLLRDKTHGMHEYQALHHSILPLGASFQFAALTKIVPVMDRMWSNFGIGYNSSFLHQMEYTSILLHLRVGDRHESNLSQHNPNHKSFIQFNPPLGVQFRRGTAGVPFQLDEQSRRVHKIFDIGIESAPSRSFESFNVPILFHIDTGNNGMAINNTAVYEDLAFATHGEWRDLDSEMADLLMPDRAHQNCRSRSNDDTKMLYVPFHRANAPPLRIVLSPEIILTIPGPAWVLSDDGATFFFTYHKNVLGLPVLACSDKDFVFDDDALTLYVLEN